MILCLVICDRVGHKQWGGDYMKCSLFPEMPKCYTLGRSKPTQKRACGSLYLVLYRKIDIVFILYQNVVMHGEQSFTMQPMLPVCTEENRSTIHIFYLRDDPCLQHPTSMSFSVWLVFAIKTKHNYIDRHHSSILLNPPTHPHQ